MEIELVEDVLTINADFSTQKCATHHCGIEYATKQIVGSSISGVLNEQGRRQHRPQNESETCQKVDTTKDPQAQPVVQGQGLSQLLLF